MPANSVLQQISSVPEGARNAILRSLRESLRQAAAIRFSVSPEKVIVRDIQPDTDLGFTNARAVHTYAAANAEENIVDRDLEDTKFLGIAAIAVLSGAPETNVIRFKRGAGGATTLAVVNVRALLAGGEAKGYLVEPIVYSPGEHIRITGEAGAAQAEEYAFVGFVAEAEGSSLVSTAQPTL